MTEYVKRPDPRRSGEQFDQVRLNSAVTTVAFSGRRRGMDNSIVELSGTSPEDHPSRLVRAFRQEGA